MPARFPRRYRLVLFALSLLVVSATANGQDKPKPDFPPHATILKGYTPVAPARVGEKGLFTLWKQDKKGQMLAELPRGYSSKKFFMAMTLSAGDSYAGLQSGDRYVYFRRFDKRLALMEPELTIRAEGDANARASVKRLFTDRIITDIPILCMGPGGGPVIDLDALFVQNATQFFSPSDFRPHLLYSRYNMMSIKTAKTFKNNIEVAFEVPASNGQMKVVHYSVSDVPNTGYKPRVADERIGYFTTAYSDLSKYEDDETRVRYINRWHLEKADPSLKVSPPKKPIKFYIEHTTPIRYRRWVKQGILSWNEAFEKIGISDAIVVEYQDAKTGQNMDLDPEDVNYNFVRWLNNNVGTAIGPSRVHPMTGQILDADIILTDGWIRHYETQFTKVLPKLAMENYGPKTLAWLAKHPQWDPRIRLAAPSERNRISAEISRTALMTRGGHPASLVDATTIGDQPFDGLIGRVSQVNGMCNAADGLGMDVAMMRMHLALMKGDADDKKDEEKKDDDKDDKDKKDEKKPEKPKEQQLDGMPESFVGPLVAHLVAHEVGHTLGLRHNFKASSLYTMEQINSDEVKGKKQLAGSVMDYIGVNFNLNDEAIQGDWAMTGVGPYDMWAIEYGYTTNSGDLKKILGRVAEPELAFCTDEDTWGPDPLARRYDFSKNPLDFAKAQMKLARHHRGRILKHFVNDGQSWSKARAGYEMTLNFQVRAINMMSNWIGGAFVHRDKKGDKNGRAPIEVVPADTQREALNFVLENSLFDESFGLTPELLKHMTVDKWSGEDGYWDDPTWPIHDRIMGIQVSTLTSIMNPTTLEMVYDNEYRIASDKDMLTIPELLGTVTKTVWKELEDAPEGKFTARKPMISSMRRNLQREHMERLTDLMLPDAGSSVANKPIANLARMELLKIGKMIEKSLGAADKQDPYTQAHLLQAQDEIKKAMNAEVIYNVNAISSGGGGGGMMFLLKEEERRRREAEK